VAVIEVVLRPVEPSFGDGAFDAHGAGATIVGAETTRMVPAPSDAELANVGVSAAGACTAAVTIVGDDETAVEGAGA
jgi:hypothetical protein